MRIENPVRFGVLNVNTNNVTPTQSRDAARREARRMNRNSQAGNGRVYRPVRMTLTRA